MFTKHNKDFMQLKILPFGIIKDMVGGKTFYFELNTEPTIRNLRSNLLQNYPTLANLNSLAIAVNGAYATEEQMICEGDEIVLIPPVSGG